MGHRIELWVATAALLAGCGPSGAGNLDATTDGRHADAGADRAASRDGESDDAGATPPMCGTLDPDAVEPDEGHAFRLGRNFGFRGDTTAEPSRSPLRLFEDGRELGPAHSALADVRASGAGAFSHAGNTLYFSSSDNTDPRENGRTYAFAGPCWEPATIDLVTVAPSSTHYATFQSHNQRIVESGGSIFLSYLAAIPYAEVATWRIARSTDGGQTFETILEGSNTTKAASLERDDVGNVYAILSQDHSNSTSPALFYRFDAAGDFQSYSTNSVPNGSAGKFTTCFDPVRQQIHFFTFWDAPTHNYFALNLDGSVAHSAAITKPGSNAKVQYPFLSMIGADLFAAWTTSPNGSSATNYWDIHWMVSSDGGFNWKTSVNAAFLTVPVVADDTGPTYRITLSDEFGPDTFLAALYGRGDSLHFMYDVYQSQRQHYVRVNKLSGSVEKNIWPRWRGGGSELHAFDGFFTAAPGGWLFAVGAGDDQRLVILASDDNGETWLDYARSEPMPEGYAIYSVAGSRAITADGHILGAFTRQQYPNVSNDHSVQFFRVDATRTLP